MMVATITARGDDAHTLTNMLVPPCEWPERLRRQAHPGCRSVPLGWIRYLQIYSLVFSNEVEKIVLVLVDDATLRRPRRRSFLSFATHAQRGWRQEERPCEGAAHTRSGTSQRASHVGRLSNHGSSQGGHGL